MGVCIYWIDLNRTGLGCWRLTLIALFTCLCLKDKLGLCSINCHTQAITGNCFASLQVLTNSLRLISAIIGNPPLLQKEIFCFQKPFCESLGPCRVDTFLSPNSFCFKEILTCSKDYREFISQISLTVR